MRILNIWDNQRYLCIYMYIHLRKPRIIGKFIRLGLFLLQDTAGSAATVEYIEYLLDLGRITQILRKIAQSSSEMAKIARPAQEIPKFLGQSLCYCVLIEKLIIIFRSNFLAIRRHSKGQLWLITRIFFMLYIKLFFSIAGNSCKFLHNVSYCQWTTFPPS